MINRARVFFILFSILLAPTFPLRAADKPVSDDLIYDNVKRKLATDPIVKGGALELQVKNGVVTLIGKLDSEKQREKAEKIARKVKGVSAVENKIQVVVR